MAVAHRGRARPLRAVMTLGIILVMALPIMKLVQPSASAAAVAAMGVAGACDALPKVDASWWYDWYVEPGACRAGEFIPMVSGEDKNKRSAGDIAWQRDRAASGGYKTILGFNEPNREKSSMTVGEAVNLWPTLTTDPTMTIGSPATTNGTDGQQWFEDFMSQVDSKGLRVDFVALHWYGWNAGSCEAEATALENYIKWAESISGSRPIWITEFGCLNQSNPDMATVTEFLKGALNVFARHPRIVRYAWYPYETHHELVDSTGALTPVGKVFASAPSAL